ncbi:MAG TPA: bifunctional phosphopantothenoylcysteine decarboxylase/phosphopantothenate--cysteine ligase CoaBC, partial [Chitinophagaceae bacterium]|nr:bifunctional phosphopantothenoylcysteine decarboxylase/phosphopantothenate--cysteine ligase CoaBC [Chitinophagaceae bacterium]
KKILLGVCGSIAAYKAAYLVRHLIKQGAEVKVILTPSAKDFISPLTLSTLSKNPVLSELFDEQSWTNHVMLGRWADVMLVAPASCNSVAKMANGLCDNLLLAVYLSATCPVVIAPAMDEDMWHHPSTKENIVKLQAFGNKIIPVEKGELASGLHGDGRMAEPESIAEFLQQNFFLTSNKGLSGKKALVTAGPTYEPIDPVRFIGNHSSGKMGWELAAELKKRGAEVILVSGPTQLAFADNGIKLIRVNTAEEMFEACANVFDKADITIMAAAVADYTPEQKEREKIKKKEDGLTIKLTKTKDILQSLGTKKKKGQFLAGFALETNNEEANAIEKLKKKNADMIVLNSLNDTGAGFGHDTNKVTIFTSKGDKFIYETRSKTQVAKDIIDKITELYEV